MISLKSYLIIIKRMIIMEKRLYDILNEVMSTVKDYAE